MGYFNELNSLMEKGYSRAQAKYLLGRLALKGRRKNIAREFSDAGKDYKYAEADPRKSMRKTAASYKNMTSLQADDPALYKQQQETRADLEAFRQAGGLDTAGPNYQSNFMDNLMMGYNEPQSRKKKKSKKEYYQERM
jgi:hypothetical protein